MGATCLRGGRYRGSLALRWRVLRRVFEADSLLKYAVSGINWLELRLQSVGNLVEILHLSFSMTCRVRRGQAPEVRHTARAAAQREFTRRGALARRTELPRQEGEDEELERASERHREEERDREGAPAPVAIRLYGQNCGGGAGRRS